MDLKKLLEGTLDDLDCKDLKSFKWHLKNLTEARDGFPNISNNKLPVTADRQDIVDVMVTRYESPEEARKVAVIVLRKMNNNNLARKLEDSVPQFTTAVPVQDHDGSMSRLPPKKKTPAELEKEGFYSMASESRGVCVIINNVDFGTKKRKGSDIDAEALAKVFSWLKFRVVMCKDKTAVEIPVVLKVFSELKQLSDLQQCGVKEWVSGQFTDLKDLPKHSDAFVCCLLSHGEKEGVCGTDGTVVPTIDILSPFNGTNCSILVEKPKLFFIQACRGKDVQGGVPVNKKPKVEGTDRELDTDNGQVQDYTLPLYSDYLVFMANVEQYVSIRNVNTGSWFIQSLCGQLGKGCTGEKDIHAIITLVNAEVSKMDGKLPVKDNDGKHIGYEKVKQSPDSRNTLTKTLIFPAETTYTS
ncbi:caspase-7-like [Salvelinus fontinalis]|uniref:caspase-7-like n=1 Tax=Salvelinus fontinalis TaxID=8038 RepID=UPI002486C394|nr:caspase-7-like [Salvelinus fontinalis]